MRIGLGHDVHRLVEGRKLIFGGVPVEYHLGPYGHSDGDVLLHALTDAVLGAAGLGDIGNLVPRYRPEVERCRFRSFCKPRPGWFGSGAGKSAMSIAQFSPNNRN